MGSNPAEAWLATLEQHGRTLDTLDAAGKSYGVANVATQLMLVLEVFERHIDDLRDGYLVKRRSRSGGCRSRACSARVGCLPRLPRSWRAPSTR